MNEVTPEEKLIVNRLKATFADVDEMQKVFDIVVNTLALREAELSVAKALLTRAADALEEEFGPGNTDLMTKDPWALIAELRKAAAECPLPRLCASVGAFEAPDGHI